MNVPSNDFTKEAQDRRDLQAAEAIAGGGQSFYLDTEGATHYILRADPDIIRSTKPPKTHRVLETIEKTQQVLDTDNKLNPGNKETVQRIIGIIPTL